MIQNLFASQIWKVNLNIEKNIVNDILDQIELNYKNNQDHCPPDWECKIHSSYKNNKINTKIDYHKLYPHFKNEYEQFTKGLNLINHNYKIQSVWYNYYLAGYNQEYHDHVGQDHLDIYSMVYFLKLNEEHPKITFYNYTNYHIFFSSNHKIKSIYPHNINNSIIEQHWNMDVKEGDLIIFPSYLPHGVFVQKTNNPRITISLNISLL